MINSFKTLIWKIFKKKSKEICGNDQKKPWYLHFPWSNPRSPLNRIPFVASEISIPSFREYRKFCARQAEKRKGEELHSRYVILAKTWETSRRKSCGVHRYVYTTVNKMTAAFITASISILLFPTHRNLSALGIATFWINECNARVTTWSAFPFRRFWKLRITRNAKGICVCVWKC